MADRDLFDRNQRWYCADRVLATFLVGDSGYDGIRSIANEDGSDGTVRISTANLNAARIDIAMGNQPGAVAGVTSQEVNGAIAFGVLAGHTHGSIVDTGRGAIFDLRDRLLLRSLRLLDDDFPSAGRPVFGWQRELLAVADPAAADDQLQNTVVHLSDHRHPTSNSRKNKKFEQDFYKRVISDVHAYAQNKAWRSLYLDINAMNALQPDRLFVSVSAMPEFKPSKQPVGYLGAANNSLGELVIANDRLSHYFSPHRTLLLRMVVPRFQAARVFEMK